jgi:hypothetical protein
MKMIFSSEELYERKTLRRRITFLGYNSGANLRNFVVICDLSFNSLQPNVNGRKAKFVNGNWPLPATAYELIFSWVEFWYHQQHLFILIEKISSCREEK